MQEANVTRRHIPGTNRDDTQFAGRGNFLLTTWVQTTASSHISTLMTSVDSSGRTFNLEGNSYSNVRLIKAGPVQRLGPFDGTDKLFRIYTEWERAGT